MDKICLLAGWGVARSALFLLEDQDDDFYFQFFFAINGLGFFAHAMDAAVSSWTTDPQLQVPDKLLYGISCVGGSAGASLSMVFFQNKRNDQKYQLGHTALCIVQGIVLMSFIQVRYDYSIDEQLAETIGELQYTTDMIWQNLLSRFSWNSKKHRPPSFSAARFLNTFNDHFNKNPF